MPTVSEVRAALAGAVETIPGLRCSGVMLDTINPPCAEVIWRPTDPRLVFSGAKHAYNFGVQVFVGRVSERAAENKLDGYREMSGAGSISAAVENGDNWNVIVDIAEVTSIGATLEVDVAGVKYLSGLWEIEVVF